MRLVKVTNEIELQIEGLARHRWAIVVKKRRRNGEVLYCSRPFSTKRQAVAQLPAERNHHRLVEWAEVWPTEPLPPEPLPPEPLPSKLVQPEPVAEPEPVLLFQRRRTTAPPELPVPETADTPAVAETAQALVVVTPTVLRQAKQRRSKRHRAPAADPAAVDQPEVHEIYAIAEARIDAARYRGEIIEKPCLTEQQRLEKRRAMVSPAVNADRLAEMQNGTPTLRPESNNFRFRAYSCWALNIHLAPHRSFLGKFFFMHDWEPPFSAEHRDERGKPVWGYQKQAVTLRLHPSFRAVYAGGKTHLPVIAHVSIAERVKQEGAHPMEINNDEWRKVYTLKGAALKRIATFVKVGELLELPFARAESIA